MISSGGTYKMRIRTVVILAIALLGSLFDSHGWSSARKVEWNALSLSFSQPTQRWNAATFRGLKVGQSTLADALRIFGKPKWVGPEVDRSNSDPDPPVHYTYESGGEFPGRLAIIVGEKSKKIQAISNSPDKLSKEEAIRHFGPDFIIGRYQFCPDIDGPTGPVYEDPNGPITYIEYRNRGISLYIDMDESVVEITYDALRKPLSSKADCEKLKREKHPQNRSRKRS